MIRVVLFRRTSKTEEPKSKVFPNTVVPRRGSCELGFLRISDEGLSKKMERKGNNYSDEEENIDLTVTTEYI